MQEIKDKLDVITHPNEVIINDIINATETIFKTSRNNTFTKCGVKWKNDEKGSKTQNKKWFTSKCQQARKNIHLARRMFNTNKTNQNIENLLARSKEYKT